MDAHQILLRIADSHRNSRRLFQKLSGGRAFTLVELANDAEISRKAMAEILRQMVEIDVLGTRVTRARTYYFTKHPANDNLSLLFPAEPLSTAIPAGMKYSRHCYGHLAGYVGVRLTRAMLDRNLLRENDESFEVTPDGWQWFEKMGIEKDDFDTDKNPAKKCLDCSERRSHLSGQLGDALLKKLIDDGKVNNVPNSREMRITAKGKSWFLKELGINLSLPADT